MASTQHPQLYPPQQHGSYQYMNSTESFMSVPKFEQDNLYQQQSASGFEEEDDQKSAACGGKRVWLIVGAIILVIAIAGGVAAGVILSKNKNSSSSDNAKSSNGIANGSSGSPSSFTQNPNLHKSFPGLCYSPPYSSFYPNCGDTIAGVITDVQLMSQLTDTIRLYGADCNTSMLMLDAIQQTKVDMKVFLGLYFDDTVANGPVFQRQLGEIQAALRAFGTANVEGIVVGNEFILNAFNAARSGSAAATAQRNAQQIVLANIATVRTAIAAMNLPNSPPIGTGDAGSMITAALSQAADFVMANVHAFFAGVQIAQAAAWTNNYLFTDTPSVAFTVANHPNVYAAEVGWPFYADLNGSLTLNGSAANMANGQTFLSDYVCTTNANNTKYFYFEAFDETWKIPAFGGAEGHWGLFYANRTLKDIEIPNCPVSFRD